MLKYENYITSVCCPLPLFTCLYSMTLIRTCLSRFSVVSLFLSFEVVSARQGTYTVTCVATGGRLSSSSLTGPGLPSSGVTLQAVGSVGYTGQNAYIGTSTTFSHSVGAMYDCTARNDVSSPRTTLVITGIL